MSSQKLDPTLKSKLVRPCGNKAVWYFKESTLGLCNNCKERLPERIAKPREKMEFWEQEVEDE